jgi:DNA-binding NarL/FixJ family response regulator
VAALAAAGRSDEAAALTEVFAAGVSGRVVPAAQAGLIVCRAVLAGARNDLAAAAALYGEAAAAWRQLPRPYDALLATQRQAACLLRDGQREPGQQLLTQAAEGLRQLEALGAARAETAPADAESGPQAAGPRRGRGRPGYGDKLSPREQEVVRLIARGDTNIEVARALMLSPRTIDKHVQSAMRKLQVASRTELAIRAVETRAI